MNDTAALRNLIATAQAAFAAKPLAEAATGLFNALGYKSKKTLRLEPNTRESFIAEFVKGRPFNRDAALLDDWQTVDFLFQLIRIRIGAFELGFDAQSCSLRRNDVGSRLC